MGCDRGDVRHEVKAASGESVIARHDSVISSATRLAFYPLVVTGGEGAMVRGADGRERIDFLASAASLNVGIQHPRVVHAVREQAARLLHYNAAYVYHEPMVELAERLIAVTPGRGAKRVSFGLSGGDAIDGTIKASRHFTGRTKVIAFDGAYHGTTYGAISVSSVSREMRAGLGPFLPEVYHATFDDLSSFDALVATRVPAEEVAVVIVEPIQGDSGVQIPTAEFMRGLAERCRTHGMLLAVDEVQTGVGRTGRWFASEHFGLEPDIVVCGKGLASGMPLSAIVARDEILSSWRPPAHTFSSGANPVTCAAALATLDIVRDEGLVEVSRRRGELLIARLRELASRHALVGAIRGRGLMVGAELVTDPAVGTPAYRETAKVCWRAWQLGLLITFLRGNVLRMVPPLVISEAQLDRAVEILDEALTDVERGTVSDEEIARVRGW
ncbi:MAG TPA: aminotransferase class III-fold pyridoxal phosphate-dependent enzyme [Candidatus Limnocylindria bacterium]|nr:aminotransferase class III-fold pyridoxal phosphate-dependent enzyme [Candidatus Limnocylindria bacterium]